MTSTSQNNETRRLEEYCSPALETVEAGAAGCLCTSDDCISGSESYESQDWSW